MSLNTSELNVIRTDRKEGQNVQNKTHVMRKWNLLVCVAVFMDKVPIFPLLLHLNLREGTSGVLADGVF